MEIRAAGRRFGPSEQSLSAPVAPPAALQRDGSPLPPPDSEDEQDAAAEGTDTCTQSLHQAVWLGDVHQILELLEKQADVNAEDVHGVTPLMLAVELMPRAEEYQAVVDCLLHQGARPRVRSSSGWSPLDEAVSRRDGSLVRKLFDAAQQEPSRFRGQLVLEYHGKIVSWPFDPLLCIWLVLMQLLSSSWTCASAGMCGWPPLRDP
ncbi:unnamed protein product [Effrenium voratum]|nr:unnamed protein product [Effrenium voratum]